MQKGFSQSRYFLQLTPGCQPWSCAPLSPEGKTSETSSYLGTKGNMTITASLRKALTGPSRAGRGGKVAGPCGEGIGIIIIMYEKESPVFSYV